MGLTGDRVPCAGGLGDGVHHKIEMFYYGIVKCSYHKKHNDINISKQLLDRNCI